MSGTALNTVDLSLVDKALENPDVFTTLITLFLFLFIMTVLVTPMFFMLRNKLKEDTKSFKQIADSLVAHTKQDSIDMGKISLALQEHNKMSETHFKLIINATGKTTLTNEQIIEVARARVWLTSEKKLAFIRKRLEKNNLKARTEIIKKQIRTELERRSGEYISFLNGFSCSVGLVGAWVEKNFPMDEFMDELYDVIFREPKGLTDAECISQKVEDCRFIMSAYQNDLWEKLKGELTK